LEATEDETSPLDQPGRRALRPRPQQLETKERANAVRKAVTDLPPDLRTAVLLFEYEGLSHAEIASVEGCTTKAIETRLYRARQYSGAKISALVEKKLRGLGLLRGFLYRWLQFAVLLSGLTHI
jgi:DNA-directed RNA polymerase specialized sigma24 family protein